VAGDKRQLELERPLPPCPRRGGAGVRANRGGDGVQRTEILSQTSQPRCSSRRKTMKRQARRWPFAGDERKKGEDECVSLPRSSGGLPTSQSHSYPADEFSKSSYSLDSVSQLGPRAALTRSTCSAFSLPLPLSNATSSQEPC
jgi:hypothetical protein